MSGPDSPQRHWYRLGREKRFCIPFGFKRTLPRDGKEGETRPFKHHADKMNHPNSPTQLNNVLRLPCGKVLRNRLAKTAMSEQLAGRSSEPSPGLIELYRRWGQGGAGLLITGNVMVDRNAISEPAQVVVENRRYIDQLQRWSGVAKSGGAHIWMQINHAGRQVPVSVSRRAVAPSAVPLPGRLFAKPRTLSKAEIVGLVNRYAITARIAIEAGFDGVQIHAAHGYLINQFLSADANRREDEYGGDPRRRCRFLLDVVNAVREAVGPDYAVSVKLNSSDFSRSGLNHEEALQHISALECTSIDLLEISGGNFHTAAMLGLEATDPAISVKAPEAYFLEFARRARTVCSKPLMVTGGFRTSAAMNAALANGVIDMAGIARPTVVDTNIAEQLLSGATGSASPMHAPVMRADGILRGLCEIAWYTEQMRQLSRGKLIDPRLGSCLATLRYLVRQSVQRAITK